MYFLAIYLITLTVLIILSQVLSLVTMTEKKERLMSLINIVVINAPTLYFLIQYIF